MYSHIQLRVVVFVALVAVAGVSFGQRTDATFAGIVQDPSGAVLPGAEVQLVNEGTSALIQQLTTETGEFVYNFLPVGTYTLKIGLPGFKSYESRGIPLGAAQNVRRTYVLQVGDLTESVTVTDEAPLVNALSSEQRFALGTLEVESLPMINRNITNILEIGSGLSRGEAANGQAGDRLRMNGLGGSSMTITANGTDANGSSGTVMLSGYGAYSKIQVMSAEAVGEMQVVKGVVPAEYGSAMAGNLSLITKSGTKDWHGSLFHRYEGSVLSARYPLFSRKPSSVWNQFGGSLGGPIFGGPIKLQRAFFFLAYEGYRQSTTTAPAPTVPTPLFRDILTRSLPFVETKIFLNHVPLPNQPYGPNDLLARWIGPADSTNRDDHFDGKVDFAVHGGNLSVTFAAAYPHKKEATAEPLNPQTTDAYTKRLNVNYVLGWGTWTSSTRVGMNQNFFERIDDLWRSTDPNRIESTPGGRRVPDIRYSGMTSLNQEARTQGTVPSYSFEQQFAYFHGAHSWKFGGLLNLPRNGMPSDTTAASVSYQTLPDVQTNSPVSVSFNGPRYPFTSRMVNFGFFVQDDWRFNKKLVINAGVRYDRYGPNVTKPWKGDYGRNLSSYGMQPEVLKTLNGKLNAYTYNLDGLLDPVNFVWGGLRPVDSPYDADVLNIGPRFGFAYTADNQGNFVLRGGFGVNFQGFDPTSHTGIVALPYVPRTRTFTRAESVQWGLKYPMYEEEITKLLIDVNPQKIQQLSVRYDPHWKAPYAMNYTLGFQRAITSSLVLESAFVGTRGVKFAMQRTFNDLDRVTGIRPNPNDIAGTYFDNSESTDFNSWQTSLKKRLTHGLLFNIHHTWGKALSYSGGDSAHTIVGDARNSVQDFNNIKIERSLSSGDVTHSVILDWVYDVPTPFANSVVGRQVLGGWQISGIWKASTGTPLGVTQTGGRPDVLDIKGAVNKNCCSFGNTLYLNPAAFQLLEVSRASNRTLRRGHANSTPVRGPGLQNFDLSLGKSFFFGEGKKSLELRADAQNALNHTQYRNVSTNLSGVGFGEIIGTQPARVIQVQARLAF